MQHNGAPNASTNETTEEKEQTLDDLISGFKSKRIYPQSGQIDVGGVESYLFAFKWCNKVYPGTQIDKIISDTNKSTIIKLFVQLEGDIQRYLYTFETNTTQKKWRIIDKEKVAEP